jgi:hypothetical protein
LRDTHRKPLLATDAARGRSGGTHLYALPAQIPYALILRTSMKINIFELDFAKTTTVGRLT